MIHPLVVRCASSCVKGLTSSTRVLSAGGFCDILNTHTDFTCRLRVSKDSQLTKRHSRSFSVSSACSSKKPDSRKRPDSYFDEFYTVVKQELELVRKDEKLTKWQKMSDDPEDKQRAANKWIFMQVMEIYSKKNEMNRRGHCEFIQEALNRMYDMGLERELACYKALFRAFPQNSMIVKNIWEELMVHFPKQQNLAMEVMDHMSRAGCMPDHEFARCVADVFGTRSPTFKKVRRMIYWMPKFKHVNPYKLPHNLPGDSLVLALMALKKMAVDPQNTNTVWKILDESLKNKETFAASAQSPDQQELLRKHPQDVPLYVEGGFTLWLRNKPQTYFILKAEADEAACYEPTPEEQDKEDEKIDEIETMFDSEESGAALMPAISPHTQADGTIFAMCITGTSTKDSLRAWIRHLQESNPNLEKTPIVFTLRTPEEDSLVTTDLNQKDVTTQGAQA